MRSLLLTAALPILLLVGCMQQNNEVQIAHQKKILAQARNVADAQMMRGALYELLVLNDNKGPYKDTLLDLYFSTGMYAQSLLLSREMAGENTEDTILLERMAVSEEMLGLLGESLENYQKLYAKSNKVDHLYQIASIQYRLKRYQECNTSLNALVADKGVEKATVMINYGQNRQQDVPMIAAIYNLNGVLNIDLKNYQDAAMVLQKALEVSPDFELAKGNLDLISQIQQQEAAAAEATDG